VTMPAAEASVIPEPATVPAPATDAVVTAPATTVPTATAPAPIEKVLQNSGLVLVQTRNDVPVEAVPEPEFRPAKRERRPPPPEVPMVQVQTREDQSP